VNDIIKLNFRKDFVLEKQISPYQLGQLGEKTALRYLKKKKFEIVKKGFRLYRGEIDLIARDRETLVFIEVKARRKGALGLPEESVDIRKQKQIRKIAEGYLALNNIDDMECRFDVISIVFDDKGSFSLFHFEDAF
jgi:putative endonuclease